MASSLAAAFVLSLASTTIACGSSTESSTVDCPHVDVGSSDGGQVDADAVDSRSELDSTPSDVAVGEIAPIGTCRSSDDCAVGTLCSMSSGACVKPTACGKDADSTGTSTSICSAAYPCAADSACVALSTLVDGDGKIHDDSTGTCLRRCDPCAPSCATGTTCVLRRDGRGVCAKSLGREGDECNDRLQRLCGGGRICATGQCRAACVPDDPELRSAKSLGALSGNGGASAACGTNPCIAHLLTLAGSLFACHAGTLVSEGRPCDGIGAFCRYPSGCQLRADTSYTSGVCSPADCTTTPCSGGAACVTIVGSSASPAGATYHLCLASKSAGSGAACASDGDCVGSMTCASTGIWPGQKTCR